MNFSKQKKNIAIPKKSAYERLHMSKISKVPAVPFTLLNHIEDALTIYATSFKYLTLSRCCFYENAGCPPTGRFPISKIFQAHWKSFALKRE